MTAGGCSSYQEFLIHHVALKETPFLTAIFFRPSHTNPTSFTDIQTEFGVISFGFVRIKGACRDLIFQELPDFSA